MALDRLPADDPDRALVLATLCSELSYGSPLERLQALADEALAIAESSGDDATIVRVLNQVIFPSLAPSLLEQTLARTADALVRAERLADPVLLFFAAHARATAVFLAGDIEEMDRCIEIMGSLADQIDQPILSWTNTFHLSKRAQIAGDTDLAERLATEALQIGTDCGQPDATLFFGGQLMVVCAQRGTMGELIPLIEQMMDEAPAIVRGAHCSAGPGPRRSRSHRGRSAFVGGVRCRRLRSPDGPGVDHSDVLLCRSRDPLWGPKVRRTAVRPARSLGRAVGRIAAVSRRQVWLVTRSVVSPLSSAATTRQIPTSLDLRPLAAA